jgi:hypothetical protein
MFSSTVFAALLAASSAIFVLADPTPTTPGPGDSFTEGQNCTFAWDGDTNAATESLWKTMNVELMSGSNLAMNFITTVATLDGTVSGTYSYACPEVTPNSAIYFYQFSSPDSSNLWWTTRFTIAAANGSTTPPANANQPNNPSPAIPWGTGALVDPSQVVPLPKIGTANSSTATGGGASATGGAGGAGGAGAGAGATTTPGSSPSGFSSVSSAAPTTSAKAGTNSTNAAVGLAGPSTFGAVALGAAVVALVF